jgi:hypothetical protein
MSSDNKALPDCDCLNECGDDPSLKSCKAAACDKLKQRREQDLQRALETVRVNLLMQQYGVTTVYNLIEHLHAKVEQLPTNIDQAQQEQEPTWTDGCTEENCQRCRTHPNHRGNMQHAGIGSYPPAPKQAEPEGYKLVPAEPTEAQWNGLARDMMMWLDMDGRHTAGSLFKHLERCGTEIPQWLRDEPEMKNLDHVPSKGTRVAIIYRAMLAAAPTQPEARHD